MQGKSFTGNILRGIKNAFLKLFSNPYSKAGLGIIDVKILKHLTPGKIYQRKIGNYHISFSNPQEFLHALKEIFADKCYDQSLPEDAYIIDCGSNIGLSILYLKSIAPEANIIGFEPDEANYALLKKNIQENRLENITLHQAAVWTANTELSFEVTGSMGSAISLDNKENTIKVKGLRLKDFLSKKVDFLKIDIEGAEYEVMKDISDSLHYVRNLFVEYHGTYKQNNELLEILDILHKNGFSFYIKEAASVYDRPFVPEKNGEWNYDVQLNIFCRRELA
jgi:FkbM family methyltransferase